MQVIKSLSLSLICVLMVANADAAKFYRHVPFTFKATARDVIVATYDFSGKQGIRCSSDQGVFSIDFVYKGHQKSAQLPVTLQSNHIPDKSGEELADVTGQLTISALTMSERSEITCNYLDIH